MVRCVNPSGVDLGSGVVPGGGFDVGCGDVELAGAGPRRLPGSSELRSVDVGGGPSIAGEHGLCGSWSCLRFKIHEGAVFVPPSSLIASPACPAPRLQALREGASRDQVRSLVAEFESLTDARGASGVRYRLSSLLALVVCAMTPAGHDSITAAAEWCRRAAPEELAAFGLPYHPLLGRYVPSEKTLRSVLGRLDPAELSAAGFAYLTSLLPDERAHPAPLMPDGGPEREQRRAHQAAGQARTSVKTLRVETGLVGLGMGWSLVDPTPFLLSTGLGSFRWVGQRTPGGGLFDQSPVQNKKGNLIFVIGE